MKSDNINYEFIINIKEKSEIGDGKLLILGPANLATAQLSKFQNRPVFNRISWPFEESTIYYNDPTRTLDNLNLTGGWGLGKLNKWCTEEIAQIIKIIANKIYKYEDSTNAFNNLIFYGSSMGGFISLQLSILIKNSVSVVEIPQLDVTTWPYWPYLKENLFNGLSENEIMEKFSFKLNILDLIKREKYIPNAYLVLDCSDERDFLVQYKPFFDRLNELPFIENHSLNKIKIRIDGKNEGHKQLDYVNMFTLLRNVCLLMDLSKFKNDELISSYYKFNNFTLNQQFALIKHATCRIDLKNYGLKENQIKLVESSDKTMWLEEPSWFENHEGQGIIIQSRKGTLDLKIECINNGLLKIFLRGIYYLDKNSKIFPIYVACSMLKINETIIFEEDNIVWHNEPYIYQKEVTDGEIINIHLEWHPI
ncbi:hypothetical protein [uncultured Methanobrevibacter sp.]|uniref:hypothetical protein n=1 Tax=uncultured Methanobrevibacter sp. TaxID=253161 RepID=UPI0025D63862|nr:hypothetical protein [uncultured Methanobrevibacter sp.]